MKKNLAFRTALLLSVIFVLASLASGADKKAKAQPQKLSPSAILVEPTGAGDTTIPLEFRYAIYEDLVKELGASGEGALNKRILRSGNQQAKGISDLVTLRTTVEKFKEGSQLKRELVYVAGSTQVDLTVSLTSQDGKVLMEKKVTGKVRFFGDNLGVTHDLAKRIKKLLRENLS